MGSFWLKRYYFEEKKELLPQVQYPVNRSPRNYNSLCTEFFSSKGTYERMDTKRKRCSRRWTGRNTFKRKQNNQITYLSQSIKQDPWFLRVLVIEDAYLPDYIVELCDIIYLTNRFHLVVRVYSDNAQTMSVTGKNLLKG